MKRLGKKRRGIGIVLIFISAFVFTVPLITITPLVMGRARWSVWNIAMAVRDGELPLVMNSFFWDITVEFGSIFLVLLLDSIVIVLFPSQKLLGIMSAIGVVVTYTSWQFASIPLETMFYGNLLVSSDRVRPASLYIALLLVMLALMFLSRVESADT